MKKKMRGPTTIPAPVEEGRRESFVAKSHVHYVLKDYTECVQCLNQALSVRPGDWHTRNRTWDLKEADSLSHSTKVPYH